jgi:hypothetical protein
VWFVLFKTQMQHSLQLPVFYRFLVPVWLVLTVSQIIGSGLLATMVPKQRLVVLHLQYRIRYLIYCATLLF